MQAVKNLQKSIKKTLKKVNNIKDNLVLSFKVREVSVSSKYEAQSTNEEVPPPPPAPATFVPCSHITKAKVSPVKKEENDFQSELKKKFQQRTFVKDFEQVYPVKVEPTIKTIVTPVVAPVKMESKTLSIHLSLKRGDVPPPPPPPPTTVPKRIVTTQPPARREPTPKVVVINPTVDFIAELKNVQMKKKAHIQVNV